MSASIEAVYGAAASEYTPPEILRAILAALPDGMISRLLAGNPSTPADILETLASSTDENTRSLVATNPDLPRHLYPVLAGDACREVREYFASRTDLDDDTRTLIALAGNSNVGYIH